MTRTPHDSACLAVSSVEASSTTNTSCSAPAQLQTAARHSVSAVPPLYAGTMTESRGWLSLSRAIVVKERHLRDRRATEAIHFARSPEAMIVRYWYRLPQSFEKNRTTSILLGKPCVKAALGAAWRSVSQGLRVARARAHRRETSVRRPARGRHLHRDGCGTPPSRSFDS